MPVPANRQSANGHPLLPRQACTFPKHSAILPVLLPLQPAWGLPFPALNLFGCALCGFSVGIMWPGLFSTASVSIPRGGTTMFALLALAGDLGCSGGPTLAGLVSSYAGGSLKTGIFAAIIFPAVLLLGLIKSKKSE